MSFRFSLVALAALFVAVPVRAQEVACENGIAALPDVGAYPCRNVALVGYMPRAAFGLPGSPAIDHNDIWGWTDPQTGTEYALVATENGVGFVDLSDPSTPFLVGKLPTPNGIASVWRDVKVYADHAFIVADSSPDHGVQVFDLNRLRSVSNPPELFASDVVYDKVSSAHNIVINEATGYAYAVGARYSSGGRVARGLPASCDQPGFHVLDVRDPKNPSFVTCFSDASRELDPYIAPGYTHDGQCVVYSGPDTDFTGREICFGANEDVATIFDVTDKSDIVIVSQGQYPNDVYTHQGWLTEDQRYFLINDEIDERSLGINQRTIVMDVADLTSPEVAFIYDSGLRTIDHNLYVRGNLAFESNYERGLRIVDLRGIENGSMEEVGFFDTFPQPDGPVPNYNGQWSNYPYFESGLVIVNDINNGFFVLRPDPSLSVANGERPDLPQGFELTAPRPNPAAGVSRLALSVDTAQTVVAGLYDVAGRLVADLHNGPVSAGSALTLRIDAALVPAGVYIVRVVGERFETSRRIVLTR